MFLFPCPFGLRPEAFRRWAWLQSCCWLYQMVISSHLHTFNLHLCSAATSPFAFVHGRGERGHHSYTYRVRVSTTEPPSQRPLHDPHLDKDHGILHSTVESLAIPVYHPRARETHCLSSVVVTCFFCPAKRTRNPAPGRADCSLRVSSRAGLPDSIPRDHLIQPSPKMQAAGPC